MTFLWTPEGKRLKGCVQKQTDNKVTKTNIYIYLFIYV